MKYFSTFTGIGGFELGILLAHVEITERGANAGSEAHPGGKPAPRKGLVAEKGQGDARAPRGRRKLPHRIDNEGAPACVGFSEVDRYAAQIYQQHFPTHKNYGDITKIDATALPDFDLLVGGFPCQAFSIAGKRGGFADTRGTLFFDLARILQAKRPRLFLFENVKGLLSHDGGRTFRTIIAATAELGYDVQWQVLNSKHHGVPQNRERVFIAGHLRGTPRPEVFPLQEADEPHPAAGAHGQKVRDTASTLTARQYANWGGNFVVGTLRTHKDGEGFREMKGGVAPTLNARARQDGSQQPVIIARNQRGEVREMPISGSLAATKSSKQFSYLVQRGRGKNKGGTHLNAPTLTGKSYQDNNHVVSVAKRGRANGARMEARKDGIAGALRTGTGGSSTPTIAYTLKARADSGIDKKHPQTLVVETAGGGGNSKCPKRQSKATRSQRKETA
jgi:DNA (cytosine-5)-methyltransferase 1